MKSDHKWNAFAIAAVVAMAVVTPLEASAQSKTKKGKAVSAQRATVRAPKAGVQNRGSFVPRSVQVNITPAQPPRTLADLSAAAARRTVFTNRTVIPSARTLPQLTSRNILSTGLVFPRTGTGWWGADGPTVTTYFDPVYGRITIVDYDWGSVMYTYGYQVVNFWTDNGYVWYAYPGMANVAYPVLYR
ncbi:MAG: hypothetical protein HONBIEJF_00935 [Fimbriimonadaceae bacterium]|nr:hypothetical protein [Fimbriimonadaceae bacterium]